MQIDRPFSDACVFHKAGKTHEGYWTNDDILSQAQNAIEIFKHRWPAEEEEDIYIGQGYRYALRDQDAFCLVIQDSLQGKSELQG